MTVFENNINFFKRHFVLVLALAFLFYVFFSLAVRYEIWCGIILGPQNLTMWPLFMFPFNVCDFSYFCSPLSLLIQFFIVVLEIIKVVFFFRVLWIFFSGIVLERSCFRNVYPMLPSNFMGVLTLDRVFWYWNFVIFNNNKQYNILLCDLVDWCSMQRCRDSIRFLLRHYRRISKQCDIFIGAVFEPFIVRSYDT